jgi:NAD-dependent deacetylase
MGPNEAIAQVARWLDEAERVVVLSGAGMSTESQLPDFRSSNGLWQNHRFEELASPEGLAHDFEAFTRFYRWRIETLLAHQPNAGHALLHAWETRFAPHKRQIIVTQNVDGFHQAAGSTQVLELHGSLRTVRCERCGARIEAARYMEDGQEWCDCGGKRRPEVVLFGEGLPAQALNGAIEATAHADLMLVLGSSLMVSPANQLPRLAHQRGAKVAIINNDPTPQDHLARVIRAPIGATLRAIDERLSP